MKTGAVIVTYFPNAEIMGNLAGICGLVDVAVVVDNTPEKGADAFWAGFAAPSNFQICRRRENEGIAKALNIGIDALVEAGCDLFFLFDQDSKPDSAMVNTLASLHGHWQGTALAQLGPAYHDSRLDERAPFIQIGSRHIKRVQAIGSELIVADYLITSGSAIARESWLAIGRFDEALFIDCVDIEWGLRARAKGYQSYGCPWVTMRHQLGEVPVRVFGRQYPLHSPLRHYYFFRNTVLLLKRNYVPGVWKRTEFYKLPLRFIVYMTFTRERLQHTRMMLKGLWHGLRGVTGRFR